MMLLQAIRRVRLGTMRSQLILGVTMVYALMMALFVLELRKNQSSLIIERQIEHATALAETMAVASARAVAADDIVGLQEIVNAQGKYHELAFAMLVDRQGLVLAHTDATRVGSYLRDLPAEAKQTVLSQDLNLVDVVSPIVSGGRQVGWARVGVVQRIVGEKRALLFRNALSYALVAIVIGALLVWFVVRRFTKGLSVVQRTIDAVRGGDLQARVVVLGDDEVADIAREFNGMLDALRENDAALQSLHRRNELILNAAGEGIYGVDNHGQILFANPAVAQILGYQPSEMLFKNSHQLFHHTRADGSPNPRNDCSLWKSIQAGEVVRGGDEVFWTKDGRMICVEHVNTPIVEAGQVVGAVVVFRDVSERKAAEEAIRISVTRLTEAQHLAHLGYWELDLLTNQLVWSDEVYRIFGLHVQEFAATHEAFLERVHPDDRERVARAFSESVQKHGSYDLEYRIILPTGEIRYVQERCTTEYDPSGAGRRSLGTLLDITEHRRMESQLRQAQKMESIGTLAGGIAHDFNNILTAIIGFGEIVMEQLPPGSPLREEQGHVLKAGKRARELVKQILTFSRRTEQQARPLLIQFVVKEALKLIRASIPVSIEIVEDIDVSCGAVLADPGQIHQVVMNLCTNAYHALRETGGEMRVSLRKVVVSKKEAKQTDDLRPGPHVCLEVADNGCGMERAVLERIFEPYFTTKGMTDGGGTGLGLALVHGIVTGLGGCVSVVSAPRQGATFKVFLPLIAGEFEPAQELKNGEAVGGNEAILVVDDEEDIVGIESLILKRLGYRVTAFQDSLLALQTFREHPGDFDLVITDMTMPRMSGDELAKEILRIRPEMPIILSTGFSELIDAEKARDIGIKEYLAKPISNAELANAVRRALGAEYHAQPEKLSPQ